MNLRRAPHPDGILDAIQPLPFRREAKQYLPLGVAQLVVRAAAVGNLFPNLLAVLQRGVAVAPVATGDPDRLFLRRRLRRPPASPRAPARASAPRCRAYRPWARRPTPTQPPPSPQPAARVRWRRSFSRPPARRCKAGTRRRAILIGPWSPFRRTVLAKPKGLKRKARCKVNRKTWLTGRLSSGATIR